MEVIWLIGMYAWIFSIQSSLPTRSQVLAAAQIVAFFGVRRCGCSPRANEQRSKPMLASLLPLRLPPKSQRFFAWLWWNSFAAGRGWYSRILRPA